MARRSWSFTEFAVNSFDLYSRGATAGANGGMVNAPARQYQGVRCSLQTVFGMKTEQWSQQQLEATHVAYVFGAVPSTYNIQVGWYFVDESGAHYEIVWVEPQGGQGNPNGNVLAIYGRRVTAQGATA